VSADAPLETYLQEAASWDEDRVAQALRGARIAWRVAAAACLCVAALAVALALLMPLKRVEPFLIRVDSRSGMVDVVPLYTGRETFSRAVARYFLAHYIAVCERFDFAMAASDYEQCGAFNSARMNAALYARWSRSNPRSPLNTHKDGSTVSVRIESVSFLESTPGTGDLAQVRFERRVRQADGARGPARHWIATLQYTFAHPPSDPRTRRWNPLGFEVLDLELEPEVLGHAGPAGGGRP
jgi:type IV secretion system protein VirB8